MRTVLKNILLNGVKTDLITNGVKIEKIGKTDECGVDMGGLKAFPGLIDIHSHGAVGKDTMEADLESISVYQLEHGITTWYPTTMTMSEEDILRATHAKTDFKNGCNIPGFHMEGPFINAKYKGAQNEEFVKNPTAQLVERSENTKLVTIAPELEGASEFIKATDAVVCIGHTDADYDTAMSAFACGARCLTHTFNVMPGIHHRKPGPICAGADSDAYAQLICDGIHVHPSAVRMLVKLYGIDKVILISDSMAATGLGDGEYMFGGQQITVKDSIARTKDGNLAGSTTNLFDCVRQAIKFGFDEEVAVKMASENPARLMKLNKGKISIGYDADLIFVDDNFELQAVMINGKMM